MKHIIGALLSPMAFAIGFLWPLTTQVLAATNALPPGWNTMAVSAVIALAFGLLAQFRGSWIWIK